VPKFVNIDAAAHHTQDIDDREGLAGFVGRTFVVVGEQVREGNCPRTKILPNVGQ
jgi:hypothetical protein